jgi:hypothetical protein
VSDVNAKIIRNGINNKKGLSWRSIEETIGEKEAAI